MYKVLIVEDDPMVAMINEQYVRKNKNYTVAGKVRDGKSALKFLAEQTVDLVILDVFMPITDGMETLRQIRKMKISVEAIMVTAANDRESLEEALHFGVVDYLVKPFTYERFQMALDKFAAQKEALCHADRFSQRHIDSIIDSHKRSDTDLPKGIQEKTLQLLLHYLRQNEGRFLNGEDIAENTGLTSVTVRRYMAYLEEVGLVSSQMNYETGGRPCMLYKIDND